MAKSMINHPSFNYENPTWVENTASSAGKSFASVSSSSTTIFHDRMQLLLFPILVVVLLHTVWFWFSISSIKTHHEIEAFFSIVNILRTRSLCCTCQWLLKDVQTHCLPRCNSIWAKGTTQTVEGVCSERQKFEDKMQNRQSSWKPDQ